MPVGAGSSVRSAYKPEYTDRRMTGLPTVTWDGVRVRDDHDRFTGTFMFGTHTRAVLKRRQAMDLGSGQDLLIGSPPPCPPPSVSQERSCSGRTPAPC